jgi:lysophospholipase L1-like esterase
MKARSIMAFTALIAGALALPAATAQADAFTYVAMGDSAAAGPLIPNQDPNLPCLRSDQNYPHVAAAALGARLTDVTCSGATVGDFSGHQFGFEPAQYDALTPGTDLVSVTIGGNDIGLVQQVLGCINLLPEPLGLSCKARLTAGGHDQLAEAAAKWAPKLGAAIDEIHRRAPHAKVLVTGYGTYIRKGGCRPVQPIWGRDSDYVQSSLGKLNAAIAGQARAHGASYVDLAAVSAGHDTCATPSQRYLEGLIPTSPAAPLHPNARGMAAFGAALADSARS